MVKEWRAQGSIEFVIIISVLVLIILITTLIIQKQLANKRTQEVQLQLEEFGNIIENEIRSAKESSGDYSREFYLPEKIDDQHYNISMNPGSEITVTLAGTHYVIFIESNVLGDIHKGRNLIKKQGENQNLNITISPIT